MAPQRFASVNKPKPRPTTRIAPFRDDSSLVALRYEQTKQAEPPIPLPPPRNPLRVVRPYSTAVSRGPIVIVPPPIAPPQEEHPLFRSQSRRRSDEWKRDSGAPTSSSLTIRPEFDEDMAYRKLGGDEESPDMETATLTDVPTGEAPSSVKSSIAPTRPTTPPPRPPLSLFTMPLRSASPETPPETPAEPSSPSTPTRAGSFTKRLGKAFSITGTASSVTNRLRKKSMSDERARPAPGAIGADPDAPPVPVSRIQSQGSLKSPKSVKSSRSPTRQSRRSSSSDKEASDSVTSLPGAEATNRNFLPITTQIPADSFFDDFGSLSFSKRGSIMFGGKRAVNKTSSPLAPSPMPRNVIQDTSAKVAAMVPVSHSAPAATAATAPAQAHDASEHTDVTPDATTSGQLPTTATRPSVTVTLASDSSPSSPTSPVDSTKPAAAPRIRVLPVDTERESQKVRSLYESGEGLNWQDGSRGSLGERLEPTEEVPSDDEENVVSFSSANPPPPPSDRLTTRSPAIDTPRSASSSSLRRDSRLRREYELAGGLEDWEDVEGGDVDRYGFISQRRPASRVGPSELKSAAHHLSPRRRNVLHKRPDSAYSSSAPLPLERAPSRKVSARSLNTYTSELSHLSRRSARSAIRSATNRLPHNKDRRWMDEAGEMLTLEPGLAEVEEDAEAARIADALKHKEWERSEKWRKMAKVIKKGKDGEGMEFEFDPRNPKLIERTWKGIPDCWRAAAWRSFLLSSARAWKSEDTDEKLVAEFHHLQEVSSPDDLQIDLDVPRTINRHIMFRRRYRGGQRLMFRVLHAISLYFPDTGYVQGMASLAATLLCYYDEEQCFVMMVRLWEYRGLRRLYQPGFGGLIAALQDFEKLWLANKDVASKLNELAIDSTAYGTRWYLTLFNLSIPFPAQLRVWDVFMLLGESPPEPHHPAAAEAATAAGGEIAAEVPVVEGPSPPGFDVLHATGAALIHALRDVLLDSDFENAMKALTSWVPVKDEELLMKVTRAEYKAHHGKKRDKKA